MNKSPHTFSHPRLNQWMSMGSMHMLNEHEIFVVQHQHQDRARPTLLLIHGFPTSTFDFLDMWQTLSEDYSIVCLDMLGFGFSAKPDQRDYTIHKQADLFDALVNKFELSEYHVLAHDYGVSVAQELLARQIDGSGQGKWLSCSFLNGGLFPETHQALWIQKIMLSPAGKLVNKLTGIKQFSTSFSKVFGESTKPTSKQLSEFWELINFRNGRHVFHNLITYINDRREHRSRWLDALRNSPVPLSLINGSVDPVSGSHLVDRYKELECRLDHLIQLDDIGHYPQVEAPARVSAAYLEFLKGL